MNRTKLSPAKGTLDDKKERNTGEGGRGGERKIKAYKKAVGGREREKSKGREGRGDTSGHSHKTLLQRCCRATHDDIDGTVTTTHSVLSLSW